MSGRRSGDWEHPARRREDALEELLEHGSRNFRRYRRRATVAFVGLAVANAIGFWKIDQNADRAREDNAQVTYQSCRAGNQLRGGIVSFIGELRLGDEDDRILRLARVRFAPRDCDLVIEPLKPSP
jgi:hypothetical protein